jgi:hypothetical protein
LLSPPDSFSGNVTRIHKTSLLSVGQRLGSLFWSWCICATVPLRPCTVSVERIFAILSDRRRAEVTDMLSKLYRLPLEKSSWLAFHILFSASITGLYSPFQWGWHSLCSDQEMWEMLEYQLLEVYKRTNFMQNNPSWKNNFLSTHKENSPHFMEPKGSHSQKAATPSYSEPE